MSSCDTGPPENGANNSYNYILDDFVNGLAEESNNKDSKNIMDEGKAKNYSNKNDNSDNTDDNDFGNSDSSNSDKGNEAHRCAE